MTYPNTRLRRLRKTETLRSMVAETSLEPQKLMWPLFVVPGEKVRQEISSLPGVFHLSVDTLVKEVQAAWDDGVRSVLLFGVPETKDVKGVSAADENSLVAQAVRALKKVLPDLIVATDVCLCAYTTHGHCGVLSEQGDILNDPSLELLANMALAHAKAGADIVAPSDMMDGRVAAIRQKLDEQDFSSTIIMSYAAKYASSFYGPFRDAAHSAPSHGDRKSYQMHAANAKEAMREIECDVQEGADIVMVKPALAYLDIIHRARERFDLPIAAYHVSGEYAMVKAAAAKGWIDERAAMMESLMAIRRAGADIIITYYAREAAKQLA
ncbi:MAG: porphobilinogen synthase [Deltaproteobacteria bacterium]|nr:porphobilinogen synthase [Deltaproteobacteria bacterium]